MLLSLPPEQHASLPASVAVTAITDLLFGLSIIFWTPRDARVLIHAQIATLPFRGLVGTYSQLRCSSSGVGATVAVQGDDRFSDTHASQHSDIYHNGSSRFGRNADSAETADLGVSPPSTY
jgi:hypothetical protein